jgi:hypothetical protein
MIYAKTHRIISLGIAAVWFTNGFFCKVLNFVPRHEQIVERILGSNYSRLITLLIGLSEIVMSIWILSAIKTRLNATIQIIVIVTMNVLEFILAPDLLLWGKLNFCFAILLIFIIYYNEFSLSKNINQ